MTSVLFCILLLLSYTNANSSSHYDDEKNLQLLPASSFPDHIETCLSCHTVDTIHNQPGHTSCVQCHPDVIENKTVEVSACISCHPLGSAGKCNLVDFHDPEKGASCFICHNDCTGGETTSTSTSTGSSTTIPASSHISDCLDCHTVDDLHGKTGHSNCAQCHDGTPGEGNVHPDACIVCHPLWSPGKCDLANFHDPDKGGTCLDCHSDCTGGGSTTSSTTTTTSGGGGGSTSTIPPSGHFDICLQCHLVGDLHGKEEHNDCSSCHNGTPQAGNVQADACIACHPSGNPGLCNLAEFHGNSCLTCHAKCTDVTTTKPSPEPTTTTTVPPGHTGICLQCHIVDDLHEKDGHDDCSKCHDGTPEAGNVQAGACIACHPSDDPGTCNLAELHGSTCLDCHTKCSDTTTTIALPPPETTTTIPPPGHLGICLECHIVDDLHDNLGHLDCKQCHDGTPGNGNVQAEACIACHPSGTPGKCQLVDDHQGTCFACHTECEAIDNPPPSSTTTTTIDLEPRCIIEEIYGESSKECKLLRWYRDEILMKNQQGRALIKLYYTWSPRLAAITDHNKMYREKIKRAIDTILPSIRNLRSK